MSRTRWGELLERKPEPPPLHYYLALRPGRLFGQYFCANDVLSASHGDTRVQVDPTILREITEAEWREAVAENERRREEAFPDARLPGDQVAP